MAVVLPLADRKQSLKIVVGQCKCYHAKSAELVQQKTSRVRRPPRRIIFFNSPTIHAPWWRHQMETFSALLAICAGNSPVLGEFPAQRPVTRSFDVFFDLRLNKSLSKQWWGWWFETLSHPLWRHCNVGGVIEWLIRFNNIFQTPLSI